MFGQLYKHQEWIVGIWDLDNKMSVEFTTNGSVLIHSKNNSQVQAKFRWSDRNNTLVIRSSGSFMDSQTVRYTVEFLSQNEMVLVLQERRMFDGHGSDQFLNIAGKLIRTGTPPTNRTVTQPNPATNESKAQPNPVLLGRWVKTDFRNNANQMESILLTARTLSYSKPKMRGHGMYQYTTQLTWVSDTKAMLEVVDVTLQFNIVSDHAIIVSSRNVGFSNFEGIDGHYLRADR
jgi:hypothetical protein